MLFEELLQQVGAAIAPPGHHHARPGWVNFDCPFCGTGTRKYHMGYCVNTRRLNCWLCGPHSVRDTLLVLNDGRMDPHALRQLIRDMPRSAAVQEQPRAAQVKVPRGVGPLLAAHRLFLQERGLEPNAIANVWGVGGIGLASRLAWRLYIPITYQKRVVSWTTRAASHTAPMRYISASAEEETINHKHLLYGEDLAEHCIVINEGPLDAWAVGPGGVATLGVGYTRAQLHRMCKFPVRVVAFDNEPEAQVRAERLCRDLEVFPGQTYNVVFDKKDASRASERELNKLRRKFKLPGYTT